MISHNYKLKYCISFVFLLGFCFIYHFLFENRNSFEELFGIIGITNNTSGYLAFVHTATFYTAFYVFMLGKLLVKADNQILIRSSRKVIFLKNILVIFACSILFSICFFTPHLIFMQVHYSTAELTEINFYKLMIIQIMAYIFYFIITGNVLLIIYHLSLNLVISQIFTIGINMLLMFAYKYLRIKSPIEATLIYTKYYAGISLNDIVFQLLLLLPTIFITLIIAYSFFSRKDVL